ncbi:hypothetical protein ASC78_19680 [Variovorax sp. Root318D1]|uniref:hypothetical protein n=1 Tax=Variovorax sp. Root318D1 TaxID=1736513 RepID=UPI0006FFEA67|nr:hypothetical protein [Variovorax sp. Root318D1]KQU90111.1 hypothetical protein ASC78_19680 [Variovorax sp. Root318D1]
MRTLLSALPILVACSCGSTWATADEFLKVGDSRRSEVREAVAAHRAAQRAEIRREEAAAGRRLTAAELFELRQQVRGQWTPPGTPPRAMNSAESQPAERIAPSPPMSAARALTLPRSQRR